MDEWIVRLVQGSHVSVGEGYSEEFEVKLCTHPAAFHHADDMAFVDLEKAFDRVPQKVIWWPLRKLDVDELIVRLVQGCISMSGAMSVLVRGTVKRLK